MSFESVLERYKSASFTIKSIVDYIDATLDTSPQTKAVVETSLKKVVVVHDMKKPPPSYDFTLYLQPPAAATSV